MNDEFPNIETKQLLVWLVVSALIWVAIAAITGCALRISDGGFKDLISDQPVIPRAIEVIIEK
jgi:hypothetical protein